MDCSYLSEIYDSRAAYLEKSLLNSIIETGKPIGGGIELTSKCNLRCAHCYSLPFIKSPHMSYEEICNIVDQLADAGVLYLFITGGEPLIREDFIDIYLYIKRKGILTTVFSNGTLISDDVCKIFQEYPPMSIDVTLYGATEETYDSITGIKGSYKRCFDGLERLKAINTCISLKTILMKDNFHQLELFKSIANKFNARFRYSTLIFPRLNGDTKVLNLRLPADQVVQYDIDDQYRRKAWNDFIAENEPPSKTETEFLYMCGAALTTFHIDYSGNLCACVRERKFQFNLQELGFSEAWHQLTGVIRGIKSSNNYRCKECQFLMVCDQCPAISRDETGDPENPSSYICEIGKLRGSKLYETDNVRKR